MKKRGILSVLIIVLAIVAVGGATMAWFTDQSDPIENVFTAGTVIIKAGEEITAGKDTMDNWNPGDCAKKEFTITNKGTKSIELRGKIETQWYVWTGDEEDKVPYDSEDPDPRWEEWTPDHDGEDYDDAVVVTFDAANSGNWSEDPNEPGIWYYADGPIDGTFDDQTETEVKLTLDVCLDGPKADNQYQGKVFTLTATFQAIQASHADEWNWDDFETYNPEEEGTEG